MSQKDFEAQTPTYEGMNSPDIADGATTKPKQGASFVALLAISLPRLAIQMAWAAQWAALGPYLGTMLPKFAVQLTQIIGPVTGILVAPVVGVFSDRSTSKWGRRRPFLAIAAVLSAICYILMGFTRDFGEAAGDYGDGSEGTKTHRPVTAVLTVIFYAWMDITVNVVQTPSFLIIADFAGDRPTLAQSLGQGWSTLGSILIAAYIEIFGPAHNSLLYFLSMLAILMLVTVAICCVVAKEKPLERVDDDESACTRVKEAFYAIYHGFKILPSQLLIFCFIFFCVQYGYTAYNGNKGQFFGMEVYDGEPEGADACGDNCSEAQQNYNDGVQIAGGRADLLFNIVGYIISWILPFIVSKVGGKWTLVLALIPQSCLMALAFTTNVSLAVFWVVVTGISQCVIFALMVPFIVHVFGGDGDIGIYVGALNSANCLGQLINFIIGTGIVETSMGYKLPVFIGGIFSFVGVIFGIFFFKIKMFSM